MLDTVITILLTILAFGALIFIHELGHFIFARIFKVKVNEFSIGMGPRLFSWVSKKSGIKYSIAAFPIGGFVAMAGEERVTEEGVIDTNDEPDFFNKGESIKGKNDDPNGFDKKPAWQRFIITIAGAMVNILFGFIAMLIVTSFVTRGSTVVGAFYSEAECEEYGITVTSDEYLRVGDEIIKINGKRTPIYESLRYEVMRRGNGPVDVTVIRDGEEMTLHNVYFPIQSSEGELFGMLDFKVFAKEKTFLGVISDSWRNLWLNVRMVWESIFDLISGRYSLGAVSGPVGISSALGEAASYGVLSFLNLVAIISINLGVMNLLPIPALDGGRLLTILIEMIFRKKLPARLENIINAVGLILLLTLSVVVMLKDVLQLIF